MCSDEDYKSALLQIHPDEAEKEKKSSNILDSDVFEYTQNPHTHAHKPNLIPEANGNRYPIYL